MEIITDERFKALKNKSILVGLTYVHNDNSISHRVEFLGTIIDLDNEGLVIKKDSDGDKFWLPPDNSAIQHAPKGEYTLQTTGEVISNPDFMTIWTIDLQE
ncbi:hypothetical protein HZI73_09855 [Vallitalea pronyensis]|uniref:Uncharacterized protein n=1 Tax=Vallitalea pronyensis TaxID=1348613 RepID=A0A8J8SGG7_9FIRM|nr:hypothetical protein [Vallitalea pronyensis]QUI22586.1 hypothetical protein HZI73_09855 [Vallitalea pronyensis]